VLTSFATALERDQASNLGVRLYREKTSDFDELIKVAQQILEICNEGRKADAA